MGGFGSLIVVPIAVAVEYSIHSNKSISALPYAHRLLLLLFSNQKAKKISCLIYMTLKYFTVILEVTETLVTADTLVTDQVSSLMVSIPSCVHPPLHSVLQQTAMDCLDFRKLWVRPRR